MEVKQCSKCEEWKPRTDFYKDPRCKDGRRGACIQCMRGYYRANASRINDRRQKLRANPEVQQRIRAASQDYYRRNRVLVQAKVRAYYRATRPARYKRNVAWRKANPEKVRAMTLVANHRQRARQAGTGGTWTYSEWEALCARYGNVCLACGADGPLTVDHVVPLEVGGSNELSNLQCLCLSCNDRKGTQIIDYRPDRGELGQLRLPLDSSDSDGEGCRHARPA